MHSTFHAGRTHVTISRDVYTYTREYVTHRIRIDEYTFPVGRLQW